MPVCHVILLPYQTNLGVLEDGAGSVFFLSMRHVVVLAKVIYAFFGGYRTQMGSPAISKVFDQRCS